MAKICMSTENRLVEVRNDDQLSELEAGHGDGAAKSSEVVLVTASDLLDEAVCAQALEHSRQLRRRDVRKARTEGARLESADGEFASANGPEEIQIITVKEIETTIAPVTVVHRRRYFLQGAQARAGIINGREEVQVAMGSRADELVQRR